MAEDWRPEVARLDGRVNALDSTLKTHIDAEQKMWKDNRDTHKDLYQRVERPSWLVTWVISALGSAAVGLAVYALTRG